MLPLLERSQPTGNQHDLNCACLQNQHDLSQLAGGLEDTPFWKGIMLASCCGVVQLNDESCTPNKRVWCILEVSQHYIGGSIKLIR